MTEIAPLVASPWAIGSAICALIVWATSSGYSLRAGSKKLLAEIHAATGQIASANDAVAFVARYETVSQQLGGNLILGARWREYQQSLLVPEQGLIRATARSDDWFDLGLMRVPGIGIDLRYHAALPGLLVGAGLLFTFLGLAIALGSAGGIVADNVTQAGRNKALHDLLSAASFKFWTSVFGLLLSIIYALFRKHWLRKVELALDAFQSALDERIPLITPVQLQAETNTRLLSQTSVLEGFSNELAINLAGVFDNAFDKRLGEHIGPLAIAMQQLSQNLTNRNEDAMQTMLTTFIEKLQGGTGNQMAVVAEKLVSLGTGLEGLQAGMRDAATRMAESADAMARRMGEGAEAAMAGVTAQMTSLVETLRALAEQSRNAGADAGHELAGRLEAAASGFERSAQTVATTLAEAARGLEQRMGSQAEDSTRRLADQFDAMIQTLRGLADDSRSMGTTALEAVAARIDTAASSFQGVSERIAAALESAATQTGGTFDRGATDAVARIVAATEGMRSELQAMLASVKAAIGEAGSAISESGKAGAAVVRDSLSRGSAELTGSMSDAAVNLRQAGADASSALQSAATQTGGTFDRGAADAVARIAAATEGMRTELQTMLTAARASIGEAGSAITDSGKAGAAVMRESLGQAGAELAASMSGAAANIRQAGENASFALRQGGEAAGGRIETAGDNMAGRAEGLTRQIAGLAETAALLATRVSDLNMATSETARPLTQAAEQLRLVSETMHGAVAPLTEITRRAGDLVEKVGVIAQRLDTAQSGAIRLTDSLDKATLRFEGVDKDIANVLHQLQDGITRFATDVTRFVTQTDSNLAKASAQVGNMVKSLDQSIQDLSDAPPRKDRK